MTTGFFRAFVDDCRNPSNRQDWREALCRNMPGELGYVLRQRHFGKQMRTAGEGLRIFPGVRIFGAQRLSAGRNCNIGLNNVLQAHGEIEIGDDVLLAPGVMIWSVNHVFSRIDVRIVDQGYEYKKVVIGSGVWIGTNSFIMPGANIGDHAVISAGSVVSGRDVEPYSILAGNPARRIGTRQERAQSGSGNAGSTMP